MKKRVRAVIIENKRVLTIKRTKPAETYWVIPGGGTKEGETCEEALKREIKEELGVEVKVGELLLQSVSQNKFTLGQEEYFYACEITGGELGSGDGPEYSDPRYAGVHTIEWLDLKELENFDLQSETIKKFLMSKK